MLKGKMVLAMLKGEMVPGIYNVAENKEELYDESIQHAKEMTSLDTRGDADASDIVLDAKDVALDPKNGKAWFYLEATLSSFCDC